MHGHLNVKFENFSFGLFMINLMTLLVPRVENSLHEMSFTSYCVTVECREDRHSNGHVSLYGLNAFVFVISTFRLE